MLLYWKNEQVGQKRHTFGLHLVRPTQDGSPDIKSGFAFGNFWSPTGVWWACSRGDLYGSPWWLRMWSYFSISLFSVWWLYVS